MTCRCLQPPFDHRDFDSTALGVDQAEGRFAEVSLETCRLCGAVWLRYFFEQEGFSESGRWFRGLLAPGQRDRVTPANALAVLDGLAWHFYGGSYFRSTGARRDGPVTL